MNIYRQYLSFILAIAISQVILASLALAVPVSAPANLRIVLNGGNPGLDSGLIAHWDLDGGAGNVVIDPIGGNHGELNSGQTWTNQSNMGAGALMLDGTKGLSIGKFTGSVGGTIGTNKLSVSAWIKLADASNTSSEFFISKQTNKPKPPGRKS